jgi:hypothetical protein
VPWSQRFADLNPRKTVAPTADHSTVQVKLNGVSV